VLGVLASSDGLLLGSPIGPLDRESAQRIAALAASTAGLSEAARRAFGSGDEVPRTVIEAPAHQYLIVPMAAGAIVALLVDRTADLEAISQEIDQYGQRFIEALSRRRSPPPPRASG
jgi:predicted regulator of Ras-like GTPase activity (Roadblock/LC7/MglB family)